jgi:DNA-directed RNA polymerase III subunit RPC3
LRHGLVVLVQQGLVYHNTEADTGVTHYEANPDAAYGLVRSGKIMDVIESRYGVEARDVVQNLFLLGNSNVSDLTAAYESKRKTQSNGHTNGHTTKNGANGQSKPRIISTGKLHAILERLLETGYIEIVQEGMSLSPSDTYNKIEREILQTQFGGSTKGAKQKDELKAKVQHRLRELRESREWKAKGKKRPLNGGVNGINGANKRRRLSNGEQTVNGDFNFDEDEDDETRLDVGFGFLKHHGLHANIT